MGIAERREREKERLRTRIVEAARDIVSEDGLDALSMRSIAERIEYSPATIYLYFKDKNALLQSVVEEGVRRFGATLAVELDAVGACAGPRASYAASGRAYAIFALENTAYFRVMFELPAAAHMECPAPRAEDQPLTSERSWDAIVALVQRGIDAGQFRLPDAFRGAVIGWGLVHGLTSLYLSGHLRESITSRGEFLDLVEEAMESLFQGWIGREPGGAVCDRDGGGRVGGRGRGGSGAAGETPAGSAS